MSIFAIVVIILIGLIAFFHWIQGLFSATISAILSVIAAMMAVAYYEPLTQALLKGKLADQAQGMVLVALFGGVYFVLRVVFDKLIPGNLRLPSTVDKVGGAVMGVVAGVFSVGTLALAAQMMPFGAAIAGYAPYNLAPDRTATIKLTRQVQLVDAPIEGELQNDTLDQGNSAMILPVDYWVQQLAGHLSEATLAGDRPLERVHPDLVQELFASRVGIQAGANLVAINSPTRQDVKVEGAYTLEKVSQKWAQPTTIRQGKLAETLESGARSTLVVVRIAVSHTAAGDGNIFRFSTGAVRLVVHGKQYFPIGTFTDGMLLRSRPDDPLYINTSDGGSAANMVFQVDLSEMTVKEGEEVRFTAGAFLAVKRMALVDLSNKSIEREQPPAGNVMVKMEKK